MKGVRAVSWSKNLFPSLLSSPMGFIFLSAGKESKIRRRVGMLYVVAYDLNNPTKDYGPFYNALRGLSAEVNRGFSNLWFVHTQLSIAEVTARLQPHIDSDRDKFFVGDVTNKTKNGWLYGSTWEWVNRLDS